jgi:hypothetical protein
MKQRMLCLGLCLGFAFGLVGEQALAQERNLPTGAGRVVRKVELMILTGKSEIDWTISRILENNASKIP